MKRAVGDGKCPAGTGQGGGKKAGPEGSAFCVRVKGLEPLRLAARDPKSRLATNYNTPALCRRKDSIYGSICESFNPRK